MTLFGEALLIWYAFAPDGSLLSEFYEERSIVVFEVDRLLAEEQKSPYPVYVSEEPPSSI